MNDCHEAQRELRAALLDGRQAAAGTIGHLASCLACQDYRHGLDALHNLAATEPLLTSEVRRRTLARITEHLARRRGAGVAIAVPLAAFSVTLSLLLPLWLLFHTLHPAVGSRLLAAAGAAALIGLAGLASGVWWLLETRSNEDAATASWR